MTSCMLSYLIRDNGIKGVLPLFAYLRSHDVMVFSWCSSDVLLMCVV